MLSRISASPIGPLFGRLLVPLAIGHLPACDVAPFDPDDIGPDEELIARVGFHYEVQRLSLPGDSITLVALNDSNAVLFSSFEAGAKGSYVWQAGRLTSLGGNGTVTDLNNAGAVAGWKNHPDQGPFIWTEGAFRFYSREWGLHAVPVAINDSGVVAVGGSRAARWADGRLEVLRSPSGSDPVSLTAMNGHGEVVGLGLRDPMYAVVWEDTSGRRISGSKRMRAPAINDAGVVLTSGAGRGPSPVWGALHFPDGTTEDLGTLFPEPTPQEKWGGGTTLEQTLPNDLNDDLHVVGDATLPGGKWRGFLWVGGRMMNLSRLTMGGWVVDSAVAINEFGTILGFARDQNASQAEPVLLLRRPV